jgi:hypothetical protein
MSYRSQDDMRLLKTSSWMSRWHNATLFVTSSNGLRQDAGGRLFFDDPSFETDFSTVVDAVICCKYKYDGTS